MPIRQSKKPCAVCRSRTLARVRISATERVPVCPACISELDFAEFVKQRGAKAGADGTTGLPDTS